MEMVSEPSNFNPEMLREPVTLKMLTKKLMESLQLQVEESQVVIDGNTTMFGRKKLRIRNFKHRLFEKTLDLELEFELKSSG